MLFIRNLIESIGVLKSFSIYLISFLSILFVLGLLIESNSGPFILSISPEWVSSIFNSGNYFIIGSFIFLILFSILSSITLISMYYLFIQDKKLTENYGFSISDSKDISILSFLKENLLHNLMLIFSFSILFFSVIIITFLLYDLQGHILNIEYMKTTMEREITELISNNNKPFKGIFITFMYLFPFIFLTPNVISFYLSNIFNIKFENSSKKISIQWFFNFIVLNLMIFTITISLFNYINIFYLVFIIPAIFTVIIYLNYVIIRYHIIKHKVDNEQI